MAAIAFPAALAAALVATAVPRAEMERQAREVLEDLRADRTVRAVRHFDPAFRMDMTSARLSSAWRRLVASLGPLRAWSVDPEPAPEGQSVWLLELGSGRARARFSFGPQGVDGLNFSPLPAGAFGTGSATSLEVAVGERPLLLGGTLALPARAGRGPAALLLGPMGPVDRDGTASGVRPMRDLAEALAARGIATLRFDKRTVGWPEADPKLTVERELLVDAVQALAWLRERPEVDPARVFVVGLGLGGTVAPEVASRAGRIAAVVVASAPPHPWPLAFVEQARARLPAGSPELARLLKEADRAILGQLAPGERFRDYPGAWWTDIAGRDPAAWALRLGRPALFVRGERDALVTEDDLKIFRRQLSRLPTASVETLPGVDELLYGREASAIDAGAARRIADFLLAAPPAPVEEARNPAYLDAPQPGRAVPAAGAAER